MTLLVIWFVLRSVANCKWPFLTLSLICKSIRRWACKKCYNVWCCFCEKVINGDRWNGNGVWNKKLGCLWWFLNVLLVYIITCICNDVKLRQCRNLLFLLNPKTHNWLVLYVCQLWSLEAIMVFYWGQIVQIICICW